MKNYISGKYINQGHYRSFSPTTIYRPWGIDKMELVTFLSEANRHLGRLDMYSDYVNIDLFIQMHIAKEAMQSSRIEGTQTKMEEVFLSKKDIVAEKRNDWEEVQNYIEAMKVAVEQLHRLPFSSRLIKQAHKILLQGVRGEHKLPGEYRNSQNWIGGATINDAVFVPPVHTEVPELISDLEKFANDTQLPIPVLAKAAIIHYQFETIHPFLDGNGRVGRLLITLYLVSTGVLKRPILYLSDFFEKHRDLYYDNLMQVRTHNDIDQWIIFFLTGVIETSKKGVRTFDNIMKLQKSIEILVKDLGSRSGDALKLIEHLYQKPVIDAKTVSKVIGKTMTPTYKLIEKLVEKNILNEITGNERDRIYVFDEYMKLFSEE